MSQEKDKKDNQVIEPVTDPRLEQLQEAMKKSRSEKRNQLMGKLFSVNTFASTYSETETKAISITLPKGLIEYLNLLKSSMGYKSLSFTIRMILEDYFDRLLNQDDDKELERIQNKQNIAFNDVGNMSVNDLMVYMASLQERIINTVIEAKEKEYKEYLESVEVEPEQENQENQETQETEKKAFDDQVYSL